MGVRRARRRSRAVLFTAAAALAVLIPAAGASAGTLDQQQTQGDFGGLQVDSTHAKAQTFTPGLTGLLDQVDLLLSGISLTTPLTVQIRDGSATAPGNTVLATTSVPTTAVVDSAPAVFVPVTFPSPASVTAGTQYSIVALNDSVGWFWVAGVEAPDSAYPGGKFYGAPSGLGPWAEGNPNADLAFKTYVATPPAPSGGGGSTTPATPAQKKCKKKKAKKRAGEAAKKRKCKRKGKKKR